MSISDPQPVRGTGPEPPELSGGAIAGITFAAIALMLIGVFQVIAGLTAIFDDDFFIVTRNYTFDLDTTAWGWAHLIIGALAVAIGLGLMSRRLWAGIAGISIAMISAIANFFFIPYYPLWALLVIALDVWVIWALTRPGAIRT
jgi:hypothetical protein